MSGVKNRVALVTGCGSAEGIGFACARALAGAGAKVAITATGERIFERQHELGGSSGAYVGDLTDADQVKRLIDQTTAELGAIDIVVNNAGMVQQGLASRHGAIESMSDDDWAHHLALNVTTAFNVSRALLPAMRERRYGRIVNIASVTGPLVAIAGSAGYAAAKAAMAGLTRAMALEYASYGITCNAVLPGWIATASSSESEIRAGKAAPAGRPGTPAEVAACALFLASEEASYVNGAMLVVDGANSIVEMKGAE